MESRVAEVVVNYTEHGAGVPLVALHGGGVDHREIEAAVEAVVPDAGCRRIYPDLPGMGRSTADGLTGNDGVVGVLAGFVDGLGAGPVLLLGHSYGAYLARGVAARRPDLVRGLALLCPIGERTGTVPDHVVVHEDPDAHDALDAADRQGFDEYFVVRTRATARRYRDPVVPGTTLVDHAAMERLAAGWAVDVGTGSAVPTLIVAGRNDSAVGYADAAALLDRHPHATLSVVDGVGHALMHERPALLAALLADWLDRVRVPARRQTLGRSADPSPHGSRCGRSASQDANDWHKS